MYLFYDVLKKELDYFTLSLDTINTKSNQLSERKVNDIVRRITKIQNIFFSFKYAADGYDLIKNYRDLDNCMNTLISARDSIHSFSPLLAQTVLKNTVNSIRLNIEPYSYCVDLYYNYFNNSSGFCINLMALYKNIYRIIDSISGANRDMNIMMAYPHNKECVKDFIDYMPKHFLQQHRINTYAVFPPLYTSDLNYEDVVTGYIETELDSLRITAEAADIVLYRPYVEVLSDSEKLLKQIKRCVRITRKNGLFLAELPSASLADDRLLYFFKDSLKDFHVMNYEMTCGTVLVYGIRKLREESLDVESVKSFNEFLYDLPKYQNTEINSVFFEKHVYPSTFNKVSVFQGKFVSEREISELHEKSTQDTDVLSEVSIIKQEQAAPLLPFTKEQLGIILTSGVLNGVVDEGNDKKHLIKGVVIKEPVYTEEKNETNNTVVQKVVHRNKIKLKILQPNGNFIELT